MTPPGRRAMNQANVRLNWLFVRCQGLVAGQGDAVGPSVALAVVVDPGGEGVEAGVGGAAGQHLADGAGLGAGAVLEAGEEEIGAGGLQLLPDGDGPGGRASEVPGGPGARRGRFRPLDSALHLPPVWRPLR